MNRQTSPWWTKAHPTCPAGIRVMGQTLSARTRRDARHRPACSIETVVARPDQPAFLLDREGSDRRHRRRTGHFAGAYIEARAVARTLDLETEYLAAGKVATIMGAGV